jgi:hypothetical protein
MKLTLAAIIGLFAASFLDSFGEPGIGKFLFGEFAVAIGIKSLENHFGVGSSPALALRPAFLFAIGVGRQRAVDMRVQPGSDAAQVA